MAEDNIVNLRQPTKPLRSVTMGELFSDPPMLRRDERVRALQYLSEEIARLKAHAASAEHLLNLLLQSEGEGK